jgi:hypothetical protein
MAGAEGVIANKPDGIVTTATGVEARSKPVAVMTLPPPLDPEIVQQLFREYDPDPKPDQSYTVEAHYNAAIAKRWADEKHTVENPISGTIITARANRRIQPVRFAGWRRLNEIQQRPTFRAQKLRETHGVYVDPMRLREDESGFDPFALGAGGAPGATAPVNDEWHPLLLGPFSRNLYLYDFLDQASKAYEGYNHNPILKSAINVRVAFIMGDGPKLVFANPACQAIWDNWVLTVEMYGASWHDKLRMFYKDVEVIGESFIYAPIIAETGYPAFKYWDASTVWEIVTDPRDIENVYYAYRQFITQWQLPLAAANAPVDDKRIPVTEYVIEQVTPDCWLHVKANATIGEKRGRSDLFSVLGWGKRFKDWMTAAVVNAQISNAFVMWWNVNGAQTDVDAIKANNQFSSVPPPGTSIYTNNQVVPNLLRPEGGGDMGNTGENILGVIATSLNLPPEYLGVTGHATRATALTRGEPAVKAFEQRQQLMREAIGWMVKRVMACARARDELPKMQPKKAQLSQLTRAVRASEFDKARQIVEALRTNGSYSVPLDESFEVIMPDLQPEDISTTLKTYTTLRVGKVWSQQTYSERSAELVGDDKYDFDEEQDRMRQEREGGVETMSAMPVSMTGPGNGGKPGGQEFGSGEDNKDYRMTSKGKSVG